MTFHLAIPSHDLDDSEEFYKNLGCTIGRRYDTHVVIDFFGCQLVCHLSNLWDRDPIMYPRHFGFVIETKQELEKLWKRWQFAIFIFQEYFIRHEGKKEEHHTFFLKDPSNNVIEFKWYKNRGAIFGSV